MRYFLQFSYNGTKYHGWQSQPNAITVQEVLTKSLSTVLNETVTLMGAGRTDTGVHAKQMYAHFDSSGIFDLTNILYKLNSILPDDIVAEIISPVHPDAHARFDATSRTYQYHIHTKKNAFNNLQSWYYRQPLDVEKMNEAASLLLNFTDFECFSKTHTDVNTFNCKITAASWQVAQNNLTFTITADRFLRNMVRAIVGTLVNVGLHKISIADFVAIIESKNRNKAGFSVPAHGLFLTEVAYPYL